MDMSIHSNTGVIPSAVVKFENVNKYFGNLHVLNDIDL